MSPVDLVPLVDEGVGNTSVSPLPQRPISPDYPTTSPVDPHVAGSGPPYLTTHSGNPAGGHTIGVATAAATVARHAPRSPAYSAARRRDR